MTRRAIRARVAMQPLQPHSISTSRKIDFERTIRRTKKPPARAGALFSSRIRCLSPYRNAGLSIQRAKLIHANALGGGRDYQFHPDGIRTLEIRSLGRLAQGVDAVLRLPGGRVGGTGAVDYAPRG